MVQLSQFSQLSVNDRTKDGRNQNTFVGLVERDVQSVAPVGRLDVRLDDIGAVNSVTFCPYPGAEQLLVVGTGDQGKVIFFRINTNGAQVEFDRLEDIEVGDEITSISWSPQTQCIGSQASVKLAIGLFNQNEVHVINARFRHRALLISSEATSRPESGVTERDDKSGEEWAEVELLERKVCEQALMDAPKRGYVKDVAFEPIEGEYLAAIASEKLCVVWETQDLRQVALFTLLSPGQNVRWCPGDSNRLVVGERSGVIRMYDLAQKVPIMMFSTLSSAPLTCIDWCRSNELLLAACVGSETLFWQTSMSGLPINRFDSHHKESEQLALFNQNLFATRSRPRSQIAVFNRRLNQVLLEEQLNSGNGLSWHAKQPILVAGGYGKIVIFQLNAYT